MMRSALQPTPSDTSPGSLDNSQLGALVGCFRSQEEFEYFGREKGGLAITRWLIDENLRSLGFKGSFAGWSELIGSPTYYFFNIQSDTQPADLREQLVCAATGLSARARFALTIAGRLIGEPENAPIYVTEQATLAYRWIKARYPRTVGSEYFDEESRTNLQAALGMLSIPDETLCFQDVTQLSHPDRSFDAVLSFDVLEHVPDYQAALSEFYRVLKPGGYLILTAPFEQTEPTGTLRARLESDGSITHLEEPEYHGDPVREGGVLCFHNFGWDLLDSVREKGFQDALMALPWDYTQGMVGPLWTLVARR